MMAKKFLREAGEEHQDEMDSDAEIYDDFELLERLESLREEMEELGVSSLAEITQRITTLHHQLDKE
jgi:hypothetical protein